MKSLKRLRINGNAEKITLALANRRKIGNKRACYNCGTTDDFKTNFPTLRNKPILQWRVKSAIGLITFASARVRRCQTTQSKDSHTTYR